MASLRSGIAAIALALFLPASRRGWDRRTLLVGCAYAATMILFVLANKLTTAASTIFLQSTAPLYVLLLAPLLLREHSGRREIAVMGVLALGMLFLLVDVDAPAATSPRPLRGNLLAACAGLTWALTLIGLRSAGSTAPVMLGNALACAIALPMALPVPNATPADWTVLVYLGVFQIGLAYVLLTRGMRQVPAFEASLLLLVEPALSPVWAWAFHGERPGAGALAGGVLILTATVAHTLLGRTGRR